MALQKYVIAVFHRSGKSNANADTLSRVNYSSTTFGSWVTSPQDEIKLANDEGFWRFDTLPAVTYIVGLGIKCRLANLSSMLT